MDHVIKLMLNRSGFEYQGSHRFDRPPRKFSTNLVIPSNYGKSTLTQKRDHPDSISDPLVK